MAAIWLLIGSIFGGLGVALGAFGAHALRERLAPEQRETYTTAVQYQLCHAPALLATAWAAARWPASGLVAAAGWLFTLGVLVFSGSLYLLVFSGQRRWGAITPVGGAALIAGWASLALAALAAI